MTTTIRPLRLLSLVWLLLLAGMATAQETVTVPDLTGLNVPQAAAQLHRAGLRLGIENNIGWTDASGLPQNSISTQSIAGETSPGSAVDVTVLRSANAAVIYDDNDLTLLNGTGAELNLTGISFVAVGGSAGMAGSRWAGTLRDTQCTQVWSVGRNGAKGVNACSTIQNWLVTTNAAEHFWTGSGGTTGFQVLQNGVVRATCPVANPGRCDFYLAAGGSSDATEYVYLAYTADRLAIINQSESQWMSLANTVILNFNTDVPGAPIAVGDLSFYTTFPPDVEDVSRLAPGECIVYVPSSQPALEPPQPCTEIARLPIGDVFIFWGKEFIIVGSDGRERRCPAGQPDRLTLCIMPR